MSLDTLEVHQGAERIIMRNSSIINKTEEKIFFLRK